MELISSHTDRSRGESANRHICNKVGETHGRQDRSARCRCIYTVFTTSLSVLHSTWLYLRSKLLSAQPMIRPTSRKVASTHQNRRGGGEQSIRAKYETAPPTRHQRPLERRLGSWKQDRWRKEGFKKRKGEDIFYLNQGLRDFETF